MKYLNLQKLNLNLARLHSRQASLRHGKAPLLNRPMHKNKYEIKNYTYYLLPSLNQGL